MNWWRDSRGKVIVALLLVWIGSLLFHFELSRMWFPIVGVVAMALSDFVISFIRKKQGVVTKSAVVSGLLIGLLLDSLIVIVLAAIVASISKQFFGRGDHRHIFNPAALGVLGASLILAYPVSWWGVAWGIIPAVIVFIGMFFTLRRLRRFWMGIIFILIYFGINFLVAGANGAFVLTIDGTVFLFALIMLPEPTTSMGGRFWRFGWGFLVAGLFALYIFVFRLQADPLLSSLLTADALTYILRII